jgi:hypothetical protein
MIGWVGAAILASGVRMKIGSDELGDNQGESAGTHWLYVGRHTTRYQGH